MAGLLSFPSRGAGLLSPYRTQDPFLIELLNRASNPQADAADEAMFAANPMGRNPEPMPQVQPTLGGAIASAQDVLARPQAMPQAQAPATPQRRRVSAMSVLGRVLAPETFNAIDAERVRLQAEADRPRLLADQERIRRAVESLSPIEQLAYASNPAEFGKALASNSEAYTVSAGGLRGGRGGLVASAPTYSTVNDTIYANDQGRSTPTAVAPPAFSDVTARFNAENPVLAANSTWVGPNGQPRAQGYIAPNVTSLQPGGEALITDASGNVINRAGSTQARPMSDADQTKVAEAEANIARIDNATARARSILSQIDGGALNLNPLSNVIAGARNAVGASDQNSLNLADLKNWAEEARNTILQSANGVQTEGDALRALNVILSGTNDEKLVRQALNRYVEAQSNIRNVYNRDIARRSGSQGGASASGPVATNPTTGEQVQWNGSAWVPL